MKKSGKSAHFFSLKICGNFSHKLLIYNVNLVDFGAAAESNPAWGDITSGNWWQHCQSYTRFSLLGVVRNRSFCFMVSLRLQQFRKPTNQCCFNNELQPIFLH